MTDYSNLIARMETAISDAKRSRRSFRPLMELLIAFKGVVQAKDTLAEEVQRLTNKVDARNADFDIAIGLLGWGDEAVPGTVEGLVRVIQDQARKDLTELETLRAERESLRNVLMDAAAMSTYTIDPNDLHQLLRVVGLVHQDEIKAITEARDEAVKVATDDHNSFQKEIADSRKETIEQYRAVVAAQNYYFELSHWLPPRLLAKWNASAERKRLVEKEAESGQS